MPGPHDNEPSPLEQATGEKDVTPEEERAEDQQSETDARDGEQDATAAGAPAEDVPE